MTGIPAIPKPFIIPLFVIVCVVLAAVPSYYFYAKYKDAQFRLQNPTAATKEEAKLLVQKVAVLMELPVGEEPTIATITDTEKLKNQSFFARSANGDKVLIYTQAKKAILYRPSLNKIIDVAPVNIGSQSATPAEKPLTFTLYNGTSVVGLTKKFESELNVKIPGAVIVDRDNAHLNDYAHSIIVDVRGDKTAQTQEWAKSLGVAVSELPRGEATPSADFLIIIGADKK